MKRFTKIFVKNNFQDLAESYPDTTVNAAGIVTTLSPPPNWPRSRSCLIFQNIANVI